MNGNEKKEQKTVDKSKTARKLAGDKAHARNKSSCNDASWYAVNSQLLADTASLAFPEVTGLPISFQSQDPSGNGSNLRNVLFDGIMTLKYFPSIGKATAADDPVNVAAQAIYTYIRHANSGSANYEAPDYMIYLLALDSVNIYLEHMKRLYGLLSNYPVRNRFVPNALVKALGGDATKLRNEMADFRAYINTFALRAGSLAIPGDMAYFKRHAWLNTHVFMDSPSAKTQFYAFSPSHIYMYEGFSSETGGKLKLTAMPEDADLAALKAFGDSLLAPLLGDEDIGIMSGDTLKAFGDANLWKFTTIEESYSAGIAYNAEVLTQIHNTATFVDLTDSTMLGTISADIEQRSGIIQCSPIISVQPDQGTYWWGGCHDLILDLPMDSPNPGDVMVATRNVCVYEGRFNQETAEIQHVIVSAGSEIFWTLELWRLAANTAAKAHLSNWGPAASSYERASHVFNYAPTTQAVLFDSETELETIVTGELNNYTVLSRDRLARMHYTALLSQLAVPSIAYVREK